MMGRKPSEVFLDLWQWRALDLTPEQFTECAEAWRQIVRLEEREAERKAAAEAFFKNFPTSPIMPAPTTPGPVTCAAAEGPGDPSPAAQDDKGTDQDDRPGAVTYDCASAPMPEPAAAAAGVSKSDAGKAAMITRKRRALKRLDALRARDVSMAEIVAAGEGLTINDVLDALARRPLPLPKLAALEKAMTKLEEAATNGGETA